jgi:protein-disulfide isomerase
MSPLALSPADHVIGSPDTASVQLVVYGDYQCPYSTRAIILASDLMERLGDALVYVFRNLPLTDAHPDAVHAAFAAEAADRQGRFWDMHLHLFRNQDQLDDNSLFAYAAELELDMEEFARDFRDERTRRRLLDDVAGGEALGASSTPTFFVNGARYDGPVDGITAVVEDAATQASPPGGR